MISISDIALFLGKEKPELKVKHLKLTSGLYALVGRNGSGKSTFLNTIGGFNDNYTGKVLIDNQALTEIPKTHLAKYISVVLSKTEVFGQLTALDILFLGRLPHQNLLGQTTDEDIKKVKEIVELLNLKNLIKKPFLVLSDGEKQLIMIGRALVQDTPIILLDEPSAFLDVVNRKKIVSILADIVKQSNKLIIFSTHNIDLIPAFCDGLLMIHQNQLSLMTSDFKSHLSKLFNNEI